VKEQETQKKLFNIKRVVCIGGGVALVLVAWALLVASSGRGRVDPGRCYALCDGCLQEDADLKHICNEMLHSAMTCFV
jgi:hypothetical protein